MEPSPTAWEQPPTEQEARELIGKLGAAMRDIDLALIELLEGRIGKITNGICKASVEKKVETDQRAVLARKVRASDSVLGFVMRFRGIRVEEEKW
jgi:hypothetical protein